MKWRREQYIAHMNFEYTGREMFCELFGPLIGLEDEWRAQGASPDELDLSAFDWDWCPNGWAPANMGAITGLTPQILEETPEYILSRDGMGRTAKLCKGSATIPLPLDYPVKTMDDWLRIKPWYTFRENRVDTEALRVLKKQQQEDGLLVLQAMPGGFDEPRQLLGEEALCIAFYEQPDMLHDILATIADTAVRVIERVREHVDIDVLCVHEDMAGKSGPLAGPAQIREFILPYYRRVWEAAQQAGCTIFSQDSDGDMNAVLDVFSESGLTAVFPCEPAAGMDIVKIREKYGRQYALKGGIDKHALRGTKEDIRRELEYKMNGATRGGGTVFGLDHRIPNGVPLENYRYYVQLGREILGLPPISGKGFARMAF